MAEPVNIVLKEYEDLKPVQLEIRERAIKATIEDIDTEICADKQRRLANKRSSKALPEIQTKSAKKVNNLKHNVPVSTGNYLRIRSAISTTHSDIPYIIVQTAIHMKEVKGQKYMVYDYGSLPTRNEVILSHMMLLSEWDLNLEKQQLMGYRSNRFHVILSDGLFRVTVILDGYCVAIHVIRKNKSCDWKELNTELLKVIHHSPYNGRLLVKQSNKCRLSTY